MSEAAICYAYRRDKIRNVTSVTHYRRDNRDNKRNVTSVKHYRRDKISHVTCVKHT